MKPAAFAYFAPDTRAEALALLARYAPDVRVLAGGQSLVAAMNFRRIKPAVLIDLNRIPDLFGLRRDADTLVIGSMTRQRELEHSDLLRQVFPTFAEALPHVGYPQTRNRGTFGGSLAWADPAAELPALAVAHQARIHVQSARGERWLAAADFLAAPFSSALEPDELVVSISLPLPQAHVGSAFAEVARRQSHRAEAGAISQIGLNGDGSVSSCVLTLFAVDRRPLAVPAVAAMLCGIQPTPAAIAAAAAAIDISTSSDLYATAAYRRHLCQVLARKTLSRAVERAAEAIRSHKEDLADEH
jgi:carbon-monoxide dehydrogenase medium subunit